MLPQNHHLFQPLLYPVAGAGLSGAAAAVDPLAKSVRLADGSTLIGFGNRFVVLFARAWAYFTYDRSARLLLGRGRDAGA